MQTIPFTSDDKPEPLLTAEDLQRILQLSRTQVYLMLAAGDIPSIRISKRLRRVRRQDLHDWLERRHGVA